MTTQEGVSEVPMLRDTEGKVKRKRGSMEREREREGRGEKSSAEVGAGRVKQSVWIIQEGVSG